MLLQIIVWVPKNFSTTIKDLQSVIIGCQIQLLSDQSRNFIVHHVHSSLITIKYFLQFSKLWTLYSLVSYEL